MASTKRSGDKPKGGRSKKGNGTNGAGARDDFQEDVPRGTTTEGDGNNSDALRLKSLDDAVEKWCDLQDQEEALIEKHIEPIRKKKNAVKSDLKRDFEIPTEAFNARAANRRIERRKDNDEVVLALNELYKATPVGKNLDLIAIAERVATKKAAVAAEKAKAQNVEHTI